MRDATALRSFLIRAGLFSLASNAAVLAALKYGWWLWPEGLPAHSNNIFWLASGVNVAGLLILGLRFWPVILLDAIPAWLIVGEPLDVTVVASACNALEALLAAWMILKLGRGEPLRRAGALMLASLIAPLVNTLVVPAYFIARGILEANEFWRALGSWNLANGTGMLVVTPLLLAIWRREWGSGRRKGEAMLLYAATAIACGTAFGAVFRGDGMNFAFIIFPVVIYAAVRFGGGELAVVFGILLLSVYTVLAVYAHAQTPEHLASIIWFVQAFCWVLAATGLFVAAQNEQRRLADQRTLEASIQAERARLDALRYQVNPHFLFNSLNSIWATLPDSAEVPREMVTELAGYFRATLKQAEGDVIPLREEVQSMRQYLAIEEKRFGENLRVTIEVDPAAEPVRVPIFLLQPLVENAIRHGFAASRGVFFLQITARFEGETLALEVANSGQWKEPGQDRGLGLKNVRRRLDLLYNGKAVFRQTAEDGWVKIHLAIPVHNDYALSPA